MYEQTINIIIFDTCVGGSKLECEVYHAFLIRLCVNQYIQCMTVPVFKLVDPDIPS